MPDFILHSYLYPTTTLEITVSSMAARTDAKGTHAELALAVKPLAGSPTVSDGRQISGQINGHTFGPILLQDPDGVAWEAAGTYNYTIEFDLPYCFGAVDFFAQVTRLDGTTGGAGCFSTAPGLEVTAAAGTPPGQITGVAFAEDPMVIADASAKLSLSWNADANALSYDIYYRDTLSSEWNHLLRTVSTSIDFYLPSGLAGRTYRFAVAAYGYYGRSILDLVNYADVRLAVGPSAIAAVAAPLRAASGESIQLSWAAPTNTDGMILGYDIQVARLAQGSATWSNFYDVISYWPTTSFAHNPANLLVWTAQPGDSFMYRVRARNSYELPGVYTNANATELRNGSMRVQVGSSWKRGIPWVLVGSVWKKAITAYVRKFGEWKEVR